MGELQFLYEIEKMDSTQLEVILRAVMERYEVLFPDWETVCLALPKSNLKMRKMYLEIVMEYLDEDKK